MTYAAAVRERVSGEHIEDLVWYLDAGIVPAIVPSGIALTVEQAAEMLAVTPETVQGMLDRGELVSTRAGDVATAARRRREAGSSTD